METVWIIGAGKFGRLAASKLADAYQIVMIDTSDRQLKKFTHPGIQYRNQNGIQFLAEHLSSKAEVAWIIPCLPVHLAWQWCRAKLGNHQLIPEDIDRSINAYLPNPVQPEATHIYVSHADFVCPDNCSEPDTICTKTRQPRKRPMFALLESLNFKNYTSFVIRSHQIEPGVGGYRPGQLFQLLTDVENAENRVLVSTACKCHGVISGGRVVKPKIG